MTNKKEIILGVTGGIAAYKACDILRRLQDHNCNVTVIMTPEAKEFVTTLTFATLSGKKVYSDLFEKDQSTWEKNHVSLAQKADVVLIAPATANIIGKIANGLADDLLSCIAMAAKAPIVIAPAMNNHMYANKIVQDNIKKLKDFGIHFIDPVEGRLACGINAVGHLASTDDIVKATLRFLKK